MIDVREQLKQQNNGTSWRACEDRKPPRRHMFGPTETLPSGTIVRSCRRCPVSIMTVLSEREARLRRIATVYPEAAAEARRAGHR
jgi:hypothetical protein